VGIKGTKGDGKRARDRTPCAIGTCNHHKKQCVLVTGYDKYRATEQNRSRGQLRIMHHKKEHYVGARGGGEGEERFDGATGKNGPL